MLKTKKIKEKISFAALAKILETNPSTLYSWGKYVPKWRAPLIEQYCKEHNIDISDCYEGGCDEN